MIYDTVYKCDLYSITDDINVLDDLSKKENIANASKKVVDTIMVQATFSNKFYREIITGILIPVYRKTMKYGIDTPDVGKLICKIPGRPVFIEVNEKKFGDVILNSDLTAANFDEVKSYIEQHQDVVAFKNHLNVIFQNADEYYENNRSDKYKIHILLKSMRKK